MIKETKVCKTCKKELQLTDFPKNGKYHKNTCKKCEYIQRNKYQTNYSREELKTITKVCETCGKEKNLLNFTKNTTHKSGYYNSCKICLSKNKTWYKPKFELGKTKKCSKCLRVLPLTSFSRAPSNKDGLRSWCKTCDSVIKKENRSLIREKVQAYKTQKGCVKCGETEFSMLDFHHINPSNKINNISNMMDSGLGNKLWDEIDKCVILCRNHHTHFHYLERTQGITLEEYLKEVG